jgi:thioredoxin-related protein
VDCGLAQGSAAINSLNYPAMRKALLTVMLSVLVIAGAVAGDNVAMKRVSDLRDEARVARADNLVLVLEFSSDDCTYCRKLEDLFLLPMQRNAEYDEKILIRTVSLDSFETLVDFDGQSMSTADFASRYGVSLTPTLLFLNADGEEMSDKLVGIWSEDFYGGFIDNRIDEAREKLTPVGLAKSGI